MSAESKKAKEILEEISNIEFDSASSVYDYCSKVRDLQKAINQELSYAADELRVRLQLVKPPPGEGGRGVRTRARSVARHLKRAGEASKKAGIEATRTWASLVRHFDYALGETKPEKPPINLGR